MKALSIVFSFLLIICSCAPSLKELRKSNPDNIMESAKAPKEIANCFYYEAQKENDNIWNPFWNRAELVEKEGIYYLTLSSTGGLVLTQTVNAGEVKISPNSNGGSIIEIRGVNRTNKRIMDHLNKCL